MKEIICRRPSTRNMNKLKIKSDETGSNNPERIEAQREYTHNVDEFVVCFETEFKFLDDHITGEKCDDVFFFSLKNQKCLRFVSKCAGLRQTQNCIFAVVLNVPEHSTRKPEQFVSYDRIIERMHLTVK